jgi:hypothetical protein
MDSQQEFSPAGRLAIGIAFLITGIGMMILTVDRNTFDLATSAPEDTFKFLFEIAFALVGALLCLPERFARVRAVLFALVLTTFALILDWIAFGPGERRFQGSVAGGGIAIPWIPPQLVGRSVFGVGAVFLDVVALLMWIHIAKGGSAAWATPVVSPAPSGKPNVQGSALLTLYGLFAGLCTIIALLAAVSDSITDRAQMNWPLASTTVDRCAVEWGRESASQGGREFWYVSCRLKYTAAATEWTSSLRSPSSYSSSDTRQMRAWTARHRRHSTLAVHYDPTDPRHLRFVAPDLPPLVVPRATTDFTLAFIAGTACFVLLLLAKVARHFGQ